MDSIEDRIVEILRTSKKTFQEIKNSFSNITPYELKEILLEMEENGEIEFHQSTGLWYLP